MLAGLVLAGLVLAAGTLTWTGRAGPWLLALLSLCWLVVNHPMEGRILVEVSFNHGLTTGDLAGLAGFAVAIARAIALARAQRPVSRHRAPR